MSRLFVLAALCAVVAAVPLNRASFSNEDDALWTRFKKEHGKVYFDQHDESYRKSVFVANMEKIRAHEETESTYTLAMNEFGDLTFEEFHAKYTGYLGLRHRYLHSKNVADLSHVEAANDVDWVSAGAVTGVKNQGQCGSCWAFSSTGAIEGAWFISKGSLQSLSEQQLMDCSRGEGNNSCEGGLMDYAFEYVISKGGICSESSYPYKEADQYVCNENMCDKVASISSYHDVAASEQALEQAATQQPVAVAIEADQSSFQFYSSGVMTGTCGTQLDHGVLVVGYGSYNGTPYWKVKNSWGESWGMNGYILLEKGKSQQGGQCGILLSASYPTV